MTVPPTLPHLWQSGSASLGLTIGQWRIEWPRTRPPGSRQTARSFPVCDEHSPSGLTDDQSVILQLCQRPEHGISRCPVLTDQIGQRAGLFARDSWPDRCEATTLSSLARGRHVPHHPASRHLDCAVSRIIGCSHCSGWPRTQKHDPRRLREANGTKPRNVTLTECQIDKPGPRP